MRRAQVRRARREDMWSFMIMGGRECRVPLFVSDVERASLAAAAGLMRADVLLELNGQNVEHVLHARACEILRGALQLTLVVKNHKACEPAYTLI